MSQESDTPRCRCCQIEPGVCTDPDLGPVCGECKGQLVIMDFNLRDVALVCGASGFKRQPHEANL